jgi:YD repeat-containing protein
MMPDPRKHNRKIVTRAAITLFEVIATLSVLLVLGVSAANLLGAITDIGARTAQRQQGRASIERLAASFRRDVHNAGEVTLRDSHWPIELKTAAATIRYEWDDQASLIERRASAGETRLAVEQFRLPDRCNARISLSQEIVTLVLSDDEQTQPWIIEASRR